MENINNSYFEGYYKDIWKNIVPAELTIRESDFIRDYFRLQPGSCVLDLMCGNGRHAITLAKSGMNVTAVDNLKYYIDEVRAIAERENLHIDTVQSDVVEYEAEGSYDLALCMGNSLCFFDKEDTIKILRMVSRHLKPDGFILINSWMLAEIAFKDFRERSWTTFGDLKFITDSKYFTKPSRIETDHLILAADGKTESKKAIDYIYSINEMEEILNTAGFDLLEIYSIPGKKKFTIGDPRAYIIGQKRS